MSRRVPLNLPRFRLWSFQYRDKSEIFFSHEPQMDTWMTTGDRGQSSSIQLHRTGWSNPNHPRDNTTETGGSSRGVSESGLQCPIPFKVKCQYFFLKKYKLLLLYSSFCAKQTNKYHSYLCKILFKSNCSLASNRDSESFPISWIPRDTVNVQIFLSKVLISKSLFWVIED